jgi:hypothetical protein
MKSAPELMGAICLMIDFTTNPYVKVLIHTRAGRFIYHPK